VIQIGPFPIGPGHPAFLIAEAGVNHNGDLELARRLVDVAAAAGASAVKFQTFATDRLVSAAAPMADYQKQNTGSEQSQAELLRRLELSEADHRTLQSHCRSRGILFMSTPFDEESADLLAELEVPVFKIPSGEITNLPFLRHLARLGRPLIVSTGMATLAEVETAVMTLEDAGARDLILLHCVSTYPARPEDTNLRAMATMCRAFQRPVGLSDHTPGVEVSIAAAALGACVIEKHFTVDRTLPGPDHLASLEPDELALLVRSVRSVEAALGTGRKAPVAAEASTAAVARKSLVAARDIAEGAVITEACIAIRRPGTGLPPVVREQIVGRSARTFISAGSLIALDMIQ
jgi:N-acetylneuraminate synthase